MNTTVTIPSNAAHGDKHWVARILGRDPKTKYEREFCPPTVASTGLFEATTAEKKGRTGRAFYLVVRDDQEGLILQLIGDETLALVLDRYGVDAIDKMIPYRDADGKWRIRKDGAIALRTSRDELLAERKRLQDRIVEIDAQLAS